MPPRYAHSRPQRTTMQTKQQREQPQGTEQHQRQARNALIEEQVLHALGRPGALLKVDVRLLWENYYRVNVFFGPDAASARVAHSYFVGVDSDVNIVESTPKITKRY
jgi:hypothetical protein